MSESFAKLRPGMEKDQVLEEMGSPTEVSRAHSIDHWKYTFYENDVRIEKEIQFENGKVIYLGNPVKPIYSAEEIDQKHRQAAEAISEGRSGQNTKKEQTKKSESFQEIN